MNLISSSLINDDNKQQYKFDHNRHSILNIDYECNQCSKLFASEYGFHYHINMYHPNQSIYCSDCNLTFRSHRALKNHQQRFHLINTEHFPKYHHLSSYLNLPFSTQQFTYISKNACEQGDFPLGELSSKLFQCQYCSISFPSFNSLKAHRLNQHEQYEYRICQTILHEIIIQVEENLRTSVENDEYQAMKDLLAKQASDFGLVDKQLAVKFRSTKQEFSQEIFPKCQHSNRTCANLCLNYLSSYQNLIKNYPYKISIEPKGNPFAQGSIVSNGVTNNTSTITKEILNSNQKAVKSSIQSKRKTTEQSTKINEVKSLSNDTALSKKILSKNNHSYTRSLSSLSSTSSTSTRSSSKPSRLSLKRSISPTISLAVERSSEKRRRQREQRRAKALSSSSLLSSTIKTSDNIEQENGDDEIISKKSKQRQASNSSVEYVQVIHNDQQPISSSSLNNIENYDDDIIMCHSPPTLKKVLSSPNKNSSKTLHKINNEQTSDYDENIRVRCKICGDIIEGRSRFSKHVLTMHSHLLNNNISDIKQQPQPNTIVYSM